MSEAVPYSDEELIRRAVLYPAHPLGVDRARWAIVRDVFAVGSTTAASICRRFGANPDDMIQGRQIDEEIDHE